MKKNTLRFLACSMLLAYAAMGATPDGKVRFLKRQDPSFDPYTDSKSPVIQQWIRDKFMRMMVYSPYFDGKVPWYKGGLAYIDSYAIYKDSAELKAHPEWVLKDSNGRNLYIPYDCGNGTCPQYAADIANPAYRRFWIDNARNVLGRGYAGLWIDDVNTNFSVSDGNGQEVTPRDTNTNAPMTWDAWRGYVAAFMNQIRRELPGVEILHNSVWYAGPNGVRDSDANIKAQIAAADYINIERGINDDGLTGGTGDWSLSAVLSFVDRLHAAGKGAVIDDFATDRIGREYALAGYFLVTDGNDRIGNQSMTPDNWWFGYDTDLGTPTGGRTAWNGLLRRDFDGGMVLLNEPGAPTRTVTLPSAYKTLDGNSVTSVTLGARRGAILLGASALSISNVNVSGIATTSATVSWTTNRASDSRVEYGSTNAYGATASAGSQSTSHVVVLSNLTPGTVYQYRVSSKDTGTGNVTSANMTFATAAAAGNTTPASLTIMSATPAAGSAQVAVSSAVAVAFSGDLAQASIAGNVSVAKNGSTTLVATDVSYDGSAKMVRITPKALLEPSSNYMITVKGGLQGVKATTGLMMQKDVSWSFSTAANSQIFVSDLNPAYTTNGWGPIEKDRSNAERPFGDGRTLTLNGRTYSKGLGVHSYSDVRYQLNGACTSFTSTIGVDSEVPAGSGTVIFQVWADGAKLYESAKLTRESTAPSVVVNVTGRKQLSLVVTDAGDNNGNDHADWAQAQLACSGRPPAMIDNAVSALTWASATSGWGPIERNMSNGERNAGDGRAISINGTVSKSGLGVHSDSEIVYSLGGSCTSFKSTVGVDDEVPAGQASVVFQVWADGSKLYDSGVMNRGSSARDINLPLNGTSKLSLILTDAGNGNGWDHADWANPTLTCSGALPTAP